MSEQSISVLKSVLRSIVAVLFTVIGCCQTVYAEADCVSAGGCCCLGEVGNVDCDPADIVDIADLMRLIDYLFISNQPLDNRAEANIDVDPLTEIDINDVTRLIDHLFLSHQPLPDCPAPINTPPRTVITIPAHSASSPYINAVAAGNPETGIDFAWYGFDLVDHPYTVPLFEYEWRLYGPYPRNVDAENFWPVPAESFQGDTTWEDVCRQFVRVVLRRRNGETYETGNGLSFLMCDTTIVPINIDPTGRQIVCDTVLVDTVSSETPLIWFDTMLVVDDPSFIQNPRFNRIVASSDDSAISPTEDSAITMYDLYRHDPPDSTVEMVFLFWVRSVDPSDPALVDPTPPIRPVLAVEPRGERDLLIIDGQLTYEINSSHRDTAKQYWSEIVADWSSATGTSITFDDSIDFLYRGVCWSDRSGLLELLSYKAIIVLNDNPVIGIASIQQFIADIDRAANFGLNVWFCGRAMFYGNEAHQPEFDVWNILSATTAGLLSDHLGLSNIVYSGWEHHIYYNNQRIEDFVGAYSADSLERPDLVVDTALLHSRYQWKDHYPWIDSLAAIPEVAYITIDSTAEIIYRYNSRFGPDHWLPDTNYNFDGQAVAVRKETAWSRSAYWLFTPYSFEPSTMRLAVHEMLSWLLPDSTDSARARQQQ